jgi:hypothetical protein
MKTLKKLLFGAMVSPVLVVGGCPRAQEILDRILEFLNQGNTAT